MSILRCAFFDVDTRVVNTHGKGLVVGPRAVPIGSQLSQLFAFASQWQIPVVATTCVQTPPIADALSPETVHVRQNGDQGPALARVGSASAIFIERRSCGDGDINTARRVFDVFHTNPNASECIRRTGIHHWAVFGISLEYCLRGVCLGLCRLGMDVTVLVDAVVSSARQCGKTRDQVLAELVSAGARLQTTAAFLEKIRA